MLFFVRQVGRWMVRRGGWAVDGLAGGIRCVAGLPICFVCETALPVCCSVTTRVVASVFGLPWALPCLDFLGMSRFRFVLTRSEPSV